MNLKQLMYFKEKNGYTGKGAYDEPEAADVF